MEWFLYIYLITTKVKLIWVVCIYTHIQLGYACTKCTLCMHTYIILVFVTVQLFIFPPQFVEGPCPGGKIHSETSTRHPHSSGAYQDGGCKCHTGALDQENHCRGGTLSGPAHTHAVSPYLIPCLVVQYVYVMCSECVQKTCIHIYLYSMHLIHYNYNWFTLYNL